VGDDGRDRLGMIGHAEDVDDLRLFPRRQGQVVAQAADGVSARGLGVARFASLDSLRVAQVVPAADERLAIGREAGRRPGAGEECDRRAELRRASMTLDRSLTTA
jgi:hypothetical protein